MDKVGMPLRTFIQFMGDNHKPLIIIDQDSQVLYSGTSTAFWKSDTSHNIKERIVKGYSTLLDDSIRVRVYNDESDLVMSFADLLNITENKEHIIVHKPGEATELFNGLKGDFIAQSRHMLKASYYDALIKKTVRLFKGAMINNEPVIEIFLMP